MNRIYWIRLGPRLLSFCSFEILFILFILSALFLSRELTQ